MLKINFKNLKKITCVLVGSLFLLCFTTQLSFSSNSKNQSGSEKICLFHKNQAQKFVKKAINLEGYVMITQVEAKDGVIRIVSDSGLK